MAIIKMNGPAEKLYYTEAGEGTPVIFIHGNLSTGMETFSLQAEINGGHTLTKDKNTAPLVNSYILDFLKHEALPGYRAFR